VDTGSTSIGIGTTGAGTLLDSGTTGIAAARTAKAPPPSAAFIGPLGALEDIQLIKAGPAPFPEVSAPPPTEEPDPSNLYATEWTTRKEADGLYSFHGSSNFPDRAYVQTHSAQRTFVDSLGNERTALIGLYQGAESALISLGSAPYDTNPSSVGVHLHLYTDGRLLINNFGVGTSYTLDEDTKRATITFEDTGAQLTFDLSNIRMTHGGSYPGVEPGGTLNWNFPPMIFEKGAWKVYQELEFAHSLEGVSSAVLTLEKHEDGSFGGTVLEYGGIFEIELYFDEEGRVSGHMFTWCAQGDSDPSVGVKQAGSLAEVHYVSFGTDYGTINIDFSSMRVINRTGSDLVINGSTIKPVTSSGEAESTSAASGTSPSEALSSMISPSSLSIDENGVLSRLKDNGDWEPVYLLACGQFAAMNSAEERNGVYYATPASGVFRTGVSGKDGFGTITSGTLERSTTDLAHELSDMIRAQHAYAANTKVLSTIDDMLTELERL
jgi:flagellar hook protein FlgE